MGPDLFITEAERITMQSEVLYSYSSAAAPLPGVTLAHPQLLWALRLMVSPWWGAGDDKSSAPPVLYSFFIGLQLHVAPKFTV